MKAKLLILGLAFGLTGGARADLNPVALRPGSYTFGIVVPSNTVQALPYCLTADTETGAALTGSSFYEQGFYAQPGQPDSYFGIPAHNTIFTDINNPGIQFLMPPDYTTNNDLQIDGQTHTSGTLTLATPTAATNLAILACDGNGDNFFFYKVNHTDGSVVDSGYLFVPDWFDGGSGSHPNYNGTTTSDAVAWGADDRVVTGCEMGCQYLGYFYEYGGTGGNFDNNNPFLYCLTIPVSDTSPVTGIEIDWYNYHAGSVGNFYAVSANSSGTNWTPVPVGGFNQITTVAATVPSPVSATMDDAADLANPGNTWFEQGYYRGDPGIGLPPSGSTFTSQSQPGHHFQMGNYSTNNAVLIDSDHPSASIAPANPALYSAFALLTAGGNIGNGNVMSNTCILQHMDGVNETNQFMAHDWLDTTVASSAAWEANGRVYLNNRTLNSLNVGTGAPYLFETAFAVSDTNSVVTNVILQYGSAPYDVSAAYVMAASGTVMAAAPAFSFLTSRSTSYGAPVTLSGKLSAPGTVYPAVGETITVSVNGNSQAATINDAAGDFSISFNPSTLPASGTGYVVTYSFAGDVNLFGATNASTTLTVTQASLTITAEPQVITYGASVPATTLSYAGFVNGETNTALTAQPGVSSSKSGVVAAGYYPGNYVPAGAADDNYNISYASGALTVSKAALSITAVPRIIRYGTSVPATTLTYRGFVNNENNAALSTQPVVASGKSGVVPVGAYQGNYVPGGAVDANYNISYVSGNLTVEPLAVILQGTRVYNGTTNLALTNVLVLNAVGGDRVDAALLAGGMAAANVGTNAITSIAEVVLGNTAASNYTLAGVSGSVVVTPLPVTLSGSRVFDGTSSASASILAIVTNYDGSNLTISGSAGLAGPAVGAEEITDSSGLLLGGTAAANYTLTGLSGSVTITSDSVTSVGGLTLVTNGYGTITQGSWPNSLVIGSTYKVTAVPDAQNLFYSWLGGTNPPYSILSTSADFTFTMQSNLVLVANFVTNNFPSSAGVYDGLFYATSGVTESTAGMLRGLTVAPKGTYSGTLLNNGVSHAVSGAFNAAGRATNHISRAASQGGPLEVALALDWTQSPPQVLGTVSGTSNGTGWVANLTADLARNTLPAGEFTMLMLPDTNNAPPVLSPGGTGYALITNSAGTAKNPGAATAIFTGALADGTAFRLAAPVSQDGYVPIYANLYSSKGLLLGWLNLTNANSAGVGLTWIHPQTRSGLYPQGFTNVIESSQIPLSPWTNLQGNFGLLTNFSILDSFDDTNAVSLPVTTTDGGKLTGDSVVGTINPKTGLLTVTIGSGSDKVVGYGAVLLNSTNGGGYFLTLTNARALQLGQ